MSASAAAQADDWFGLAWRSPLHPFQMAGVARLLASESVLLADEMGLGKTIQAIAALRVLVYRGEVQSALLVAPVGLLMQWRQQLRAWAPELSLATITGPREERMRRWGSQAHVYLVGYEVLRNDRTLPRAFGPGRRLWDLVVADEAQRIKNDDTELSMVLKSLNRRRCWALTGTPVENRAEDAASILDFVAPGQLDRREMMVGLRRTLGEVQLRRRRAAVLPDLPPKTGSCVPITLGPVQRAAYDRALQGGSGVAALAGRGRAGMARAGADPAAEAALQRMSANRRVGQAGDLVRRVTAWVAAGQKVLVFSQFVAGPFGVAMLAHHLAALRPVLLTGGMSTPSRGAAIAAFSREPDRSVMVLSLRAGGIGLNLTAASAVIHFDRWWNPAVEAQAEDRAHRIGQTRPVQTVAYLVTGTIEERIAEILAEKQALFADLIDDVDVSSLRRLGLTDLLRIVGVGGT